MEIMQNVIILISLINFLPRQLHPQVISIVCTFKRSTYLPRSINHILEVVMNHFIVFASIKYFSTLSSHML